MMQGQAGDYAAAALAFSVAGVLQTVADNLGEAAQHLYAEALLCEIQATLDALQETISGYAAEAQDLIGGIA